MSEEEIWKVILGHSRYEASSLGRIRKKECGTVLAQMLSGIPQYWYVNTVRDSDNTRNIRRVHLLMAQTFLDNPEGLKMVDHINQNKLDNTLQNLRWVSPSGNGRNKYNSVYVDYEDSRILLVELVEKLFGEQQDQKIYQFIAGRLSKGEDIPTALVELERYNDVGKKLKKVDYQGQEIFLIKLCEQKGYDYYEAVSRLNRGWDEWNVCYNINPTYKGYQLKCGSVDLWFPDQISVQKYFNIGSGTFGTLLSQGFDFKDIDSYDSRENSRDIHRRVVLGFRGTMEEISEHFGKTLSCVQARLDKGMSLEEALIKLIERLKYVSIDGQRKTLKQWYKYFNLEDGKVRSWRDRNKGVSFTKTLENFGVNTSELVILEG